MYSSIKVLAYVAKLRLKRQNGQRSYSKTNVPDAGCDVRLNKNKALLSGRKHDSPSQVCVLFLCSENTSVARNKLRPILPELQENEIIL